MINKKIPLRRCIGCFQMKDKKGLIRIVKTGENEYEIDISGKRNGRGAYICKSLQCFARLSKNKGLERSFRSAVPKDIYEKIGKELEKYE